MTDQLKVLFINIYMHSKNADAIFKYKSIDLHIINNQQELVYINYNDYDYIYSPALLIDPRKISSNTQLIFGPHLSVFPDNRITNICGFPNVVYIQPSNWACEAWKRSPLCKNLRIEAAPFSIDTVKFTPINERTSLPITSLQLEKEVPVIFIYFKRRHPAELEALCNFLKERNIKFHIFDYVKKYNEEDYLKFLQTRAKCGIWLGSHESQGFALQEALSCNIPILVWNVTNMNQEYGGNLPDIPATTIPYWDERCGEQFTMFYELEQIFPEFIKNIENNKYNPRKYILENLTTEKCENNFYNILYNRKNVISSI